MGKFGGFYFGEKRKLSKTELGKKAQKAALKKPTTFKPPELVKKSSS